MSIFQSYISRWESYQISTDDWIVWREFEVPMLKECFCQTKPAFAPKCSIYYKTSWQRFCSEMFKFCCQTKPDLTLKFSSCSNNYETSWQQLWWKDGVVAVKEGLWSNTFHWKTETCCSFHFYFYFLTITFFTFTF